MTTKPYSTDDAQQSQQVSEPAVSYGIQKDAARIKLEAIDELMNIFDPDRLSQALAYLHSLGREEEKEAEVYPYYPSSMEALRKELTEAEADFCNGRIYTSDDLRKEMRTW